MQVAKVSILLLGVALLVFYFVSARRCGHNCRLSSGKHHSCKCCACKG